MKIRTNDAPCALRPNLARCRDGWTLVELLVVVLIIVVIAALSLTVFSRARAAARSATCMTNVKQVGMALLEHASDNNGKFIDLQPAENPNTGKRPPIWTVQLALKGYLSQWDGEGEAPCGTGVWTCPECDFMSVAYGGYGVLENAIFVYEENYPTGVTNELGSLRLSRIEDPANTWLVGDATANASNPKKGWYAIWPNPGSWSDHGPAARHGGKVNVCMADGHVENLTIAEIKSRKLTQQILDSQ